MRGDPREFEVETPKTLAEALAMLAVRGESLKPISGGTDLMVQLEMDLLKHKRLMSLHALSELRGVRAEKNDVVIGGATTFTGIRKEPVLQEEFPMLCEAARQVGALAIQNRGTLAGNIANASPAADSSPVLLAYDAVIELASKSGDRQVPYAEFHTGYKKLALRPDELIVGIRLPRKWKNSSQLFRKVGARAAQAISKVSFAGLLRFEDTKVSDCRLAMGSVGPVPLRCRKVEESLIGAPLDMGAITRAKAALLSQISPIDDIRSNREYRLRVSLNLLEDFLLTAKR